MASVNHWRNKALNAIISAARSGPIGLELFMAITALRWAVYLVLPATVLHNNTSATMCLMATFAPTWAWAMGFAGLALWQMAGMVNGGHRLRQYAALAGMFWWLIVTLLDYTAGLSTATINLGTFVVAQVIAYVLLVVAYDGETTT
jgi:hypothetical protein